MLTITLTPESARGPEPAYWHWAVTEKSHPAVCHDEGSEPTEAAAFAEANKSRLDTLAKWAAEEAENDRLAEADLEAAGVCF